MASVYWRDPGPGTTSRGGERRGHGWRDHRVKQGVGWNGCGEGEGTVEHFAVRGTTTGRCFLRDSWLLTGGGAVGHEG